ncbi:MAG: KH domain-containing protein [Candidatus Moraniibacteriota bacterium]
MPKGRTVLIRINSREMAEKDQEFLDFLVRSIVDYPDDVQVERGIDERGVLLNLTVNPKDMGMIIGRQGSTAKAIRTLLRVVGAKNDARINLKINEPEGSERFSEKKSEESEEAKESEEKDSEKSIDDIVNDIK